MPTASQPPAPFPRDPALDGFRGFAVLLVFLFHYGGGLRAHNPLLRALGYLTQAGWIGVDLFFALSGFLITGLLAADLLSVPSEADSVLHYQRPLRSFYARRALRILPLYLAALLACAAAARVTGASLPDLKPLLIYATFLQNLPPLLQSALHTPPPLPVFHLWSLAVEEQFYLLWPFALLAARTPRRALHLSVWIFAASCLFRAAIFAPPLFSWASAGSFATFLPSRAGALALGSALALYRGRAAPCPVTVSHDALAVAANPSTPAPVLSVRTVQSPGTRSPRQRFTATSQPVLLFALAASLALIVLTASRTHSFLLNSRSSFVFLLPAADLFSAALVALTLKPNLLRTGLSTRPLVFLGRISYGFYVMHILLEPLFDRLGGFLSHADSGFAYQTARLLCALPLTTAAAWLSFTVFETPFLRLKHRFSRGPFHPG